MKKKVRVLSLDGGGIRGVIPATIMQYVEEQLQAITNNPNARIADYFDIIVGTSTGGILGCFYLTPNDQTNGPVSKYSAADALNFYTKKGFDIFNASKYKKWGGLRQLFNSTQYNPKNLEGIFESTFGDLKMNDLLKPCVVTTYNLSSKSAFFISSNELPETARDFYVKDAVRSTSAAPTYFPPAHVKNLKTGEKLYNIDGGVFANNPTMCAYAECRDSVFPQASNPTASEMLILSIGTGGGRYDLADLQKSRSWGVLNWATSIPNIMMDGSVDTVDYVMRGLFDTLADKHQFNYKRVDVPLDKRGYSKDMADASPANMKKLLEAGQETLKAAKAKTDDAYSLDEFVQLLVDNAPE